MMKSIVARAYSPFCSVFATEDCDKLANDLGYEDLITLVAPHGDSIGRATVRDSQGMTNSYDDFAIRLGAKRPTERDSGGMLFNPDAMEALLREYIGHYNSDDSAFARFFAKLVAAPPDTAFETFSQPAAHLFCVSSRNPHPLDTLQALAQGQKRDKDCLNFYVLVHDSRVEDADNSTQRTVALLERAKKRFGLAGMIKLGQEGVPETIATPQFLTVGDELVNLKTGVGFGSRTLSQADKESIRSLLREFTVQHLIPHMERCIMTWDTVAAGKRGLTGRMFSAGKKWLKFGGSEKQEAGSSIQASGIYPQGSPEQTIRRLADYAFMLRDYRYAYATYELVKRDFLSDKAWKYLAACQEQAAVALLMYTTRLTEKQRVEVLNPLLDSACYTYISRLQLPQYALRMLVVTSDLQCLLGPDAASQGATQWFQKLLDERLVGRLGYALIMLRVSYAFSQSPKGRKAALWQLLSAREWADANQKGEMAKCLDMTAPVYNELNWPNDEGTLLTRLKGELAASEAQPTSVAS